MDPRQDSLGKSAPDLKNVREVPFCGVMISVRTLLVGLAMGAWCTVGCSQAADPGGGGVGTGNDVYSVPTPSGGAAADPCAAPAEGCPCTDLGEKASCKTQKYLYGSFVFCGGQRTCDRQTGTWSACVSTLSLGDSDGGITSASGKQH